MNKEGKARAQSLLSGKDHNIDKAEFNVIKLDLDPMTRSFTGASSRQGFSMEHKEGNGQVKGVSLPHYFIPPTCLSPPWS